MVYETVDDALRAELARILPAQKLQTVLASFEHLPMREHLDNARCAVERTLEQLDTAIHLPWTPAVDKLIAWAAQNLADLYTSTHWHYCREFERRVGVEEDRLAVDPRTQTAEDREAQRTKDSEEKRTYLIESLATAPADTLTQVIVNGLVPDVFLPLTTPRDAVMLALGQQYRVVADGTETGLRSQIHTLDGLTPVAVPWEAIYAIARPGEELARMWLADAPLRILQAMVQDLPTTTTPD